MTTSPPSDYKTAGIFMLTSGITNVIFSFIWFCFLILACVGIAYVIPLVAGVFEMIFGMALMNGTRKPSAKTVAIFGLISSILICNPIALVMEILAMIKLGKPEIEDYLRE